MIGQWLARRREAAGEEYQRAVAEVTSRPGIKVVFQDRGVRRARRRLHLADLILDAWTAHGTRDHPLARREG